MKKFRTTAAMLLLLFCMACGNHKSSIEGIYVMYHHGVYANAWDTLFISRIENSKISFKVENYTGYQRISNGRLMRKAYAHRVWIADWDEQAGAFRESVYYPPIRITANGLLLKNTAYRKLP